MVIATHIIFSTFGFWLPNDPRGSGSDFLRKWELTFFGSATKVHSTRSLANRPHDQSSRLKAKKTLKNPPVVFIGQQAKAVGEGFEIACQKSEYQILACSILPEHVHLVVKRHEQNVEQIVSHLKGAATQQLKLNNLYPFEDELISVWSRSFWKVFLNSNEDVLRSIQYVQENPLKEGKPKQEWEFVLPFHD